MSLCSSRSVFLALSLTSSRADGAVENGCPKIMRRLLKAGADPNVSSCQGCEAPLFVATTKANVKVLGLQKRQFSHTGWNQYIFVFTSLPMSTHPYTLFPLVQHRGHSNLAILRESSTPVRGPLSTKHTRTYSPPFTYVVFWLVRPRLNERKKLYVLRLWEG